MKNVLYMAMLWEKVTVTAKEFLGEKNINDERLFNDPLYRSKLVLYEWDLCFAAASVGCELVWRKAIGKESLTEDQRLDKLFSPSPVATHSNFRGCKSYKTGNVPEPGSLAVWRKGNTWQGNMAIVIDVSDDKQTFSVVEFRAVQGSESHFLQPELKQKRAGLPFRTDKLNLLGFIYAPNREIN